MENAPGSGEYPAVTGGPVDGRGQSDRAVSMTREERFLDLATKAKFLTPDQLEDCRKLQKILLSNGFKLTLPEIVARKEILDRDQLRIVHMAVRYEEMRDDDVEFGRFVQKKGFLTREQLAECLGAQEAPFREGRHFPRLEDLLVEKGYLTTQQVHVLRRARQQLDDGRKAREVQGSSPRIAAVQPSLPPEPPPAETKRRGGDLRALEGGLDLVELQVAVRKTRYRSGDREIPVHVLDFKGALGGETARRFDDWITALIDAGAVRIVACCEKLDYLSSAGIGVLAGSVKRCRDAGGDLRLCEVGEKIQKVMHLVGLEALVRTYDSERGAVMSFKYG